MRLFASGWQVLFSRQGFFVFPFESLPFVWQVYQPNPELPGYLIQWKRSLGLSKPSFAALRAPIASFWRPPVLP